MTKTLDQAATSSITFPQKPPDASLLWAEGHCSPQGHEPSPHLMKRVHRMKIISPTMLGASHQVVSGWVAIAEPVLFLTSSVGLHVWAGGDTQQDQHLSPAPRTHHMGGQSTHHMVLPHAPPLPNPRLHPAYLVHWPGQTM